MHKTSGEAAQLTKDIIQELGGFESAEVVICPPFTALPSVGDVLNRSSSMIRLGAQNMHQKSHGAFTGEISAAMLRDLFCRFVILGHSERRQYCFETDALVNEKVHAALAASLKPIVCVGETIEQREAHQTEKIIESQLVGSLANLTGEAWADVIIAYEPVWAIGTGKTATPAQAQEVHQFIRAWIAKTAGPAVAEKVRLLYGGSVKPENSADLLGQSDIDGALVGGASLEARSFATIIKEGCRQD